MKKGNIIVSLIIIVLINIGIFVAVDNYSGLFWINYCFVMLALLFTAYTVSFPSKEKGIMEKMNITAAVGVYLISEIIAALIFSKLDENKTPLALIIHLIVIGAFILFFYFTLQGNSFIKEQQQKRGIELLNFRYVLEQMKLIQQKTPYSAEYKKAIDETYDALSASQSSSSTDVETLEREIIDNIAKLNEAVDKNDSEIIFSICKKIIRISSERDSKLRLRKNF